MPESYRQWMLAAPMAGPMLERDHFALRTLPWPTLQPGQALARIKLINIHSITRFKIARGVVKPGETDPGNYACAEIVQSRDAAFKEGDIIACQAGWQEYQVISSADAAIGYGPASELVKALNGTHSQWCYAFRPAMTRMWPAEVLMDVFGTSGMTAYFGMRECGPLMPGDSVAVAGVTGGVGSLVAQIARAMGCRVVGFAGGSERCAWAMRTLNLDACIDYKAADFAEQLRAACPHGVDVFSDGVGGVLTERVVAAMNRHGRLFAYGAAAAFYAEEATDLASMGPTLRQRFGISAAVEAVLKERNIKAEAWIVDAFYHERLHAEDDLSRMLLMGRIKASNTVVDGFENLPSAIVGLYQGSRAGKLQVRFESAGGV